jgi:importin-9
VTCLTHVIRKDCSQLLAYDGGLNHVLTLVGKLLQSQDESGGLAIGDLVIHLLRRAGESILPVLPDLLQAMIERMRSAKTATFLQVGEISSSILLVLCTITW